MDYESFADSLKNADQSHTISVSFPLPKLHTVRGEEKNKEKKKKDFHLMLFFWKQTIKSFYQWARRQLL